MKKYGPNKCEICFALGAGAREHTRPLGQGGCSTAPPQPPPSRPPPSLLSRTVPTGTAPSLPMAFLAHSKRRKGGRRARAVGVGAPAPTHPGAWRVGGVFGHIEASESPWGSGGAHTHGHKGGGVTAGTGGGSTHTRPWRRVRDQLYRGAGRALARHPARRGARVRPGGPAPGGPPPPVRPPRPRGPHAAAGSSWLLPSRLQ